MSRREAGLEAAATIKKTRPDFYREIGKKGGSVSRGGGFAGNHELAVRAGAKGGSTPRKKKKSVDD